MSPVLSVTDLTYQIKSQSILSNISFHVTKKASIGIIGESGSGKTTLGRLIPRSAQTHAWFDFLT